MFNRKLFLLMMLLFSGMAVLAMSKIVHSNPLPGAECAVVSAGEEVLSQPRASARH